MDRAMLPIRKIADSLGIPPDLTADYGDFKAKLKLEILEKFKDREQGKLILVTAVNPTKYGEGKTVVSIGLNQALRKLGKRSVVTLREPSLGPVFGMKGGATGGGLSMVHPSDEINLHFTGDFHAITAANNLLAAMIDAHLHHGNKLGLDVDKIFWPRAMDMNDRSLRGMVAGLGGKSNGVPRETGFVITAASEIMAVLALATSREDLKERVDRIVVGYSMHKKVIRAEDLGVTGAMMVLLNDAILPNLAQTTDHSPAIIHAGPFANIAHGTSSVLAQRMGLCLADYVVNECGFGADLGAEKYFDIVMPSSGIKPAVVVLVATIKALKTQGGGDPTSDRSFLEKGFPHLHRHIENLRGFGVPVVVGINRFPDDTDEEIEVTRFYCRNQGVECEAVEVFTKGAEGGVALAEKAAALADETDLSQVHSLYDHDLPLMEKIGAVAKRLYGASGVLCERRARLKLKRFSDLGFGNLPVCMAKTQYSLSDDKKLLGVPEGWDLTITEAELSAGAGFVVVTAGNMVLMPGLPREPQAIHMGVDEDGEFYGLR